MLRIFGAPRRYVQGAGALAVLGIELKRLGSSAVILIDPFVEAAEGPAIRASCNTAGLDARYATFNGEVTRAEVDRLVALCANPRSPLIVAIGGGKCLDTGKALAHRLGAKVAMVPTIASTDAPTSHNYVLYDENHRLASVEKMPANPDLVVVDTAIIARAPVHLFAAGIGDAAAKLFEVDQCMAARGKNIFGGGSCESARILARGCYDIIRADGEAALAAVARGIPDETLERVVEATVLMSGLSFESGGLSIAHAMTRGLSAVSAFAHTLHGYQVAYALLVQLVLEDRDDTVLDELRTFYRGVGLPISLHGLGGVDPSDEELATMARLTLAAPHAKHFPRVLDDAEMIAAMRTVEGAAAALNKPCSALA